MPTQPEELLRVLQEGHSRFMAGESRHPHSSAHRLRHLVAGQHPLAAVVSCSDSRVPVELLFDAGFGDLYVVRTAGNTSFTDTIGSLDYGVMALGLKLIIVMGHEGCGAVTAACTPGEALTPALQDLVLNIRTGLDEEGVGVDLPKAFRANSRVAARRLIQGSELMRSKVNDGSLRIEAACYTLERGDIEWMGAVSAS